MKSVCKKTPKYQNLPKPYLCEVHFRCNASCSSKAEGNCSKMEGRKFSMSSWPADQPPLLWSVVNLFRPPILFRTHFKIFRKKSWRRPRGRFQGDAHEIVVTFRVNGSDGVTQRKGITFLFAKKQNGTELNISSCEIFLLQFQMHLCRSPCEQLDLLRCPWDRRQHTSFEPKQHSN